MQGTVTNVQEIRTYRKRMSLLTALFKDRSGGIKVLWFNQPYLKDALKKGEEFLLAGKVVRDKEGLYLASPSHEKLSHSLTHIGRIVPVYAETAGVSSRWLRAMVKTVLAQTKDIPETLPEYLLKEKNFLPVQKALWQIHFPDSFKKAKEARNRFAFEELFYILLFILSERKKIASVKAPSIPFLPELMKRFTDRLPFQLTDAQRKTAWQILKDIEKPRPMNRLLQGDVGSGKTVVATMAALSVFKAGYQTAFMAPTEILAKQHFKTVSDLLAPFKMNIGLLTGKADRYVSKKLPNDFIEISRAKLLEKVKEGEIDILIGTHALIQNAVKFGNLGLLVLDEQHRFGVKQRANLLHRGSLIPHLLSMTATPIPRTLAMTIYGDLDLSLITELPKGRKHIKTSVIAPNERAKAYQLIQEQIQEGKQVFVICPRIDPASAKPARPAGGATAGKKNQMIEMKAVKEEHKKLSEEVFPQFTVDMLHGKISSRAKEEVMKRFKRGKIHLLVATSVVEVGMDIPNATVMMIEGADRFGLAQLHQFRGRVGRSDLQSYCFLFSESGSAKSKQRLKALVESDSGFALAEKDLRLRGPGDFAGTKQWGLADFAMEQLTNLALVEEAREAAKAVLEKDISLKNHPMLKAKVEELKDRLHLE